MTLALVSVLAATILMTSSQFSGLLRSEGQLEARLAVRRVADHIAKVLEASLPISTIPLGGGKPVGAMLEGKPNEIRFTAATRVGATTFAQREITLSIEKTDKGGRLVQKMVPRRFGTKQRVPETLTIAEDVTLFRLSYFGLQDGSARPIWSDTWGDTASLPLAVSIRIESSPRKGVSANASTVALIGRR